MNSNFTWGRSSLLRIVSQALLALGALTMASAASALASMSYDFQVPATSSQNPPYTVIATLTLDELVGGGVKFTVTPNQPNCVNGLPVGCNPGFTNNTYIQQIEIAFTDDVPASDLAITSNSGAQLNSASLTQQENLDPGYSSSAQALNFSFIDGPPSGRFYVTTTSMWTIAGLTLDQFASVNATHNASGFPSPVLASMSLARYEGDTSNWVATAGAPTFVPEPTSLALLGIGLIGFVMVGRRHARG